MQPPVRIKVYGLISLTRRGYLICLAAGLVLVVVLLALWALFMAGPYRPLPPGDTTPGLLLWEILRAYMPWILLLTVALEAVEAFIVLRRFRRAEAERQTGAREPNKGN